MNQNPIEPGVVLGRRLIPLAGPMLRHPKAMRLQFQVEGILGELLRSEAKRRHSSSRFSSSRRSFESDMAALS